MLRHAQRLRVGQVKHLPTLPSKNICRRVQRPATTVTVGRQVGYRHIRLGAGVLTRVFAQTYL